MPAGISDADRAIVGRHVHPYFVAEFISSNNNGDALAAFLTSLRRDVRDVAGSDMQAPLFVFTDCAPQLQHAVLAAFGKATRYKFANMAMLILAYYESAVSAPANAESKEQAALLARAAAKLLRGAAGVFIKECKSHVDRAAKSHVHCPSKSSYIKQYRDYFETAVTCVWGQVLEEESIFVAIATMAVFIKVARQADTECWCRFHRWTWSCAADATGRQLHEAVT